MTAQTWTMSRRFQDRSGNAVDVLRRPVIGSLDAKINDLAPFFELHSIFKFVSRRRPGADTIVKGVLSGINTNTSGQGIALTVTPCQNPHESLTVDLGLIEKCLLTVWRVNDILDLIQVNIVGHHYRVYMQTGGDALLSFVEMNRGDEGVVGTALEEGLRMFVELSACVDSEQI